MEQDLCGNKDTQRQVQCRTDSSQEHLGRCTGTATLNDRPKSQEANFVMGVDTLRNRDTARPPVNQTRLSNDAKSLIEARVHALNGSWNTVVDFTHEVIIVCCPNMHVW